MVNLKHHNFFLLHSKNLWFWDKRYEKHLKIDNLIEILPHITLEYIDALLKEIPLLKKEIEENTILYPLFNNRGNKILLIIIAGTSGFLLSNFKNEVRTVLWLMACFYVIVFLLDTWYKGIIKTHTALLTAFEKDLRILKQMLINKPDKNDDSKQNNQPEQTKEQENPLKD